MGHRSQLWVSFSASVMFFVGSLAFLFDVAFTVGVWLFIVGSAGFVATAAGQLVGHRRQQQAPRRSRQ